MEILHRAADLGKSISASKGQSPLFAADSIPAELKEIPQWICWKYGSKRNSKGKFSKLPINPTTGKLASVDDPATWSSFAQAAHYARRHGIGAGLVLTKALNLVVVDLDDAITPDEALTPFAQSIVDRLDGWTEVSASGKGLHIFVHGTIPASLRTAEIEIYSHDRYIAITGDRYPGTPVEIPTRTEQIAELHAEHAKPQPKQKAEQPAQPTSMGDATLISKMLASKNGEKLRKLWDLGDWSDYPSQSEAEQALCNALAFWTGKDAVRIDQLFRQSALYRPKWDSAAYRNATIGKALTVTAVYNPPSREQQVDFSGEVADILRFARSIVAAHKFTGRHAENQQRVALAVIEIMRKSESLEAHISTRHAATVAGVSKNTADRALNGIWDNEKRQRTSRGLCEWLLEKTETGDGIGANCYRLSPAIIAEYKNTAVNGTQDEVHTRELLLCPIYRGISTIEHSMIDDAFARNIHKKQPDRSLEKQKPAGGWSEEDPSADPMIALFGESGATVMNVLLSHEALTIERLAEITGYSFSEAARTIIYLRKAHPGIIDTDQSQIARSTVLSLPSDIEQRLSAIHGKLQRVAGLRRLMNAKANEDAGLKSFTPIGLAIIAQLEMQNSQSITALATALDKGIETIRIAVQRMSTMLEQNGLEPVVTVGQNPTDKREKLVTLRPDWRQHVNAARPHLATDGVNRARNINYAMERLSRLRTIAEQAHNPATLDLIARIQLGAMRVIAWTDGKLSELNERIAQLENEIEPCTPTTDPTLPQSSVEEQPAPPADDLPKKSPVAVARRPSQNPPRIAQKGRSAVFRPAPVEVRPQIEIDRPGQSPPTMDLIRQCD